METSLLIGERRSEVVDERRSEGGVNSLNPLIFLIIIAVIVIILITTGVFRKKSDEPVKSGDDPTPS